MEVDFQIVRTFKKSMVFKQFRHNACGLRFMMFDLALLSSWRRACLKALFNTKKKSEWCSSMLGVWEMLTTYARFMNGKKQHGGI